VLATQSRDDANGTTPIDVVRDVLLTDRSSSKDDDDDDDDARDDDNDDDKYETFLLLKEIFERSPVETMQPYAKTSLVDWRDESILEWQERESIITGKNSLVKTTANTTSTSSERRRRRRIRSIWGGCGRVTLVGDAAHAMRPTDGYGGSMAMEDAAVLGRIIRQRLLRPAEDHQADASTREEGQEEQGTDDEDAIERALNDFEERRFTRVKRVYDNQYERYRQRMEEGKHVGPQGPTFLRWLNSNNNVDDIDESQ
jgi:2-polyprenyl-6-methoxyphenol hydroxylase-like FAD-dependent oxidoreductase